MAWADRDTLYQLDSVFKSFVACSNDLVFYDEDVSLVRWSSSRIIELKCCDGSSFGWLDQALRFMIQIILVMLSSSLWVSACWRHCWRCWHLREGLSFFKKWSLLVQANNLASISTHAISNGLSSWCCDMAQRRLWVSGTLLSCQQNIPWSMDHLLMAEGKYIALPTGAPSFTRLHNLPISLSQLSCNSWKSSLVRVAWAMNLLNFATMLWWDTKYEGGNSVIAIYIQLYGWGAYTQAG